MYDRVLAFKYAADEEFDELCFEFGIELDEVVSGEFVSLGCKPL